MRYVLFLIFFSLCFSVANVAAVPTPADKARQLVGKSGGGIVDEIDTNGTSYRSFGMKNRRGDSAWCRIKYKPTEPSSKASIEKVLGNGETKRKNVFEKDTAFERIIDETNEGDTLTKKYKEVVGMNDCRLCKKGSTETDNSISADETETKSFAVQKGVSRKKEPETVDEKATQPSDEESAVHRAEVDLSPDVLRRVLVCAVFAMLIAIIIILIFKKRKLQKQMINDDNYNSDVLAKLKESIAEKVAEIDTLKTENRRLREENERLRRNVASVPAGMNESTPPIVQVPVAQPVASRETFYFSNPIGSSFNEKKSTTDFENGKSIYRFERVVGDNTAEIFVENVPTVVQRFIQSSEVQMGVCDFVGGYKKDATNIETLEPGSAVLDDGKWNVRKKVKIRYC